MEIEDLPYRAEYSKSARASCRGCKTTISKDVLRLAVLVQSPMFDGKMAQWYHMNCFFTKQRPKTIADIEHYESLRYEDQQKLKEKIESLASAVVPTKGKGTKRKGAAGAATGALKDFHIEYAKSGRAACRGCEQKILKDEIRISKKDFESDIGKRYGGQDKWHHVECFAKLRSELLYFETGEKLPGFNTLKAADKTKVKSELPAIKQEEPDIKKLKSEDEVDNKKNEKENKLEQEIKEQNQIMFKYRDSLKSEFKKKNFTELLEYNKQFVPTGDEKQLDLLADIMTFGALEKCEKCKSGQFVFNMNGYICQGNISEWTKCQDVVQEPKRKAFKVPKDYKSCSTFEKYKYVPRTRKMRNLASTSKVKKEKEEEDAGPKVQREKPALYEMRFILTGFKKAEKSELTTEIKRLGGKIQNDLNYTVSAEEPVMAVITTQKEIESDNENYRITLAKNKDIHVVSADFVHQAKDNVGKIPELVKKTSICSWGGDPAARIPQPKKSDMKSKSIFTKSVPKSKTLIIKGSSAVDPDSGLQDFAHVYEKGTDKWTTVLSLTDLQTKKNSFYKLQLLETDSKNAYYVFRAWGRIGTTIGGNKLDKCGSLNEAKKIFRDMYKDKTENLWENRANFKKVPGKMYPVEVDEGGGDDEMEFDEDVPSKLEKPLQDLIRLIFDVNTMKQTMKEFELDLEKMPLGKLSKSQIQKAFGVLNELEKLIDTPDATNAQFIDCCNRFYTFIPHSFGVNDPPVINTHDMLKEKLTMLDNLLELEIAYSLMKNTHAKGGNSSLDGHYEQLKTEMSVMDKESEEFKLIQQYVKNTHASTHSHYSLDVEEVFTVSRQGESKRYKPFRKLHNRKLLWHGSRLTNFAGILSQGLRIAPPEAPVTGYMFGKGIYFADMVSKSANYCCTNSYNNTGLMLLCEVALGNMLERTNADYIEKLPSDKHSCKGVGMAAPDPKESIVKDGVEIPLGKSVNDSKLKSSLLYNEYIVYDIAQVNLKYLVKMKFDYKY